MDGSLDQSEEVKMVFEDIKIYFDKELMFIQVFHRIEGFTFGSQKVAKARVETCNISGNMF